jgi:hypothetical protein
MRRYARRRIRWVRAVLMLRRVIRTRNVQRIYAREGNTPDTMHVTFITPQGAFGGDVNLLPRRNP